MERKVGLSVVDMDVDDGDPGAISGKVAIRSGDNFKFKTYWVVLKGTRLLLYKNEKSKKPSRTLWISYWEAEKFDKETLDYFKADHPESVVDLEQVRNIGAGQKQNAVIIIVTTTVSTNATLSVAW